jgi:hypothetical protein
VITSSDVQLQSTASGDNAWAVYAHRPCLIAFTKPSAHKSGTPSVHLNGYPICLGIDPSPPALWHHVLLTPSRTPNPETTTTQR